MKTTTNITYLAFALFALVCLAFSPTARAVVPPPDGGYPNQNTAEGEDALFSLTGGFFNTAVGYHAMYDDTTGSLNTAVGAQALLDNRTGTYNTATGSQALLGNTSGGRNTATGANALLNNSNGGNNTAVGASALVLNMSGFGNTAVGRDALSNNSTGNDNIAVGSRAGSALTTGNGNIDIGNAGVAGESNTMRIGTTGIHTSTYMAGISGSTVPGGVNVVIDTSGHLGTVVSAERFKESIKPMNRASEAILALRPVTFRYKHDLDPDGIAQFGLVAEEVEKVNPDLVARDGDGKPYTVRYEAVNAMLLNEFLKEHRKVQQQEATITELKKDFRATVAQLTTRLDEQAAQIQKVSAQLGLNKPAPQTVLNNQ